MDVKVNGRWRRAGWWLYCTVLMFAGYAQMLRKLAADPGGPVSQFAPPVLVTFLVLGVVAHRNRKAVFKQWFWQLFYLTLMTGTVGVLLLAVYYAVSQGMALAWQAIALAVVLLLLPGLDLLRQYAFTSSVWPKTDRAP